MNTVLFVAWVTGDQTVGYRAHFHDIVDCKAEGMTLADLLLNARQALGAKLDEIARTGGTWPAATSIEQIESRPGAMAIPVDIGVDDTPIRVNISLGERLVQRLDTAAEARGMTRSGFIAHAVRVSLGESSKAADFDTLGRQLQDDLTALGRRINDSIGPDSAFTRRMNELDGRLYDGVRRAADTVSAAMARRRDAMKAAEPVDIERPPAASEDHGPPSAGDATT